MAAKLSPTSAWRKGALDKVNARYARFLAEGFRTADFDGQPEPETLQCRNEHDRTNWIGLMLKCQAAAMLGAGDLPIDPPLRCTSNRQYTVTHNDAQARLWVLFGQAAQGQANVWRLKDLTRSRKTREALNAIDLDAGWP